MRNQVPPSLRQRWENQLRHDWVWPSPDAGWAWWVFASRGQNPPWLSPDESKSVLNALSAEKHFDHATILASTGFAAAILDISPNLSQRWREGFERLRLREPFPHDRQAFPFRSVELLGICIGASKLGTDIQKAWLREVLEQAQTATAPFDFWRSVLGALASRELGTSWSAQAMAQLWNESLENIALFYWLQAGPPNSPAHYLAQSLESTGAAESIKKLRQVMLAPVPTLETTNEIAKAALFLFVFDQLNQLEESIIPMKKAPFLVNVTETPLRGQIDFAIISVREDEYTAVLQRFPKHFLYRGEHRTYAIHRFPLTDGRIYSIAAVRTPEPGETSAQQITRDAIADLAPRYLMVVGIAGGIPANEFTLGDVVAAMRLQDFSVHAHLEGGAMEFALGGGPMHPEVQDLLANLPALTDELADWNTPEMIGRARPMIEMNDANFYGPPNWQKNVREKMSRHWGDGTIARLPLVTTGAVASSDGLIKDAALLEAWRRSSRQLIAVEMELAGIYKGAHTLGHIYPIVAIRGISDIVGFQRHHDWTEYACETAASFAHALIQTGMFDCVPKTAPLLTPDL